MEAVFKIGDDVINNSPMWHSGKYNKYPEFGSASNSLRNIGLKGTVIDIGKGSIIYTIIYLIKWEDDNGFCSKSGEQLSPGIRTIRERKLNEILENEY